MKHLDMLGNEIKKGDFVVNATSCTGHGELRRSLITRIDLYKDRWDRPNMEKPRIGLKSIIISNQQKYRPDLPEKFIQFKKAHTGQTCQIAWDYKGGDAKFRVLKISQDITKIFTPEELEIIDKTRIKLS